MFYPKLSVCDNTNIEAVKLNDKLLLPEYEPTWSEIFWWWCWMTSECRIFVSNHFFGQGMVPADYLNQIQGHALIIKMDPYKKIINYLNN